MRMLVDVLGSLRFFNRSHQSACAMSTAAIKHRNRIARRHPIHARQGRTQVLSAAPNGIITETTSSDRQVSEHQIKW